MDTTLPYSLYRPDKGPPNMRIIGLSGKKGSGKTYIASHLLHTLQKAGQFDSVVVLSFASPMRNMIAALLDAASVEDADIYLNDREYKEVPLPVLGVSYRVIMQTLGTEWGRDAIHPDFWVKIMQSRIMALAGYVDAVIIDDVRFDNEVAFIHDMQGVVLTLTREGTDMTDTHVSEALPDTDWTVSNYGTAADTVEAIQRALGL